MTAETSQAPPATPMKFQEIENKYVVDGDFDRAAFRQRVEALGPHQRKALPVCDIYYLSELHPQQIFRHRYDHELQHLSVKSLQDDSQVRLEINLDLGQHRGNQQDTVEAFLDTLQISWRGVIQKEIEVFIFDDCEVVYYSAFAEAEGAEADAASKTVHCVEFEARRQETVEDALAVLSRYAELTGFEARQRTHLPLVEILFPDAMARFRELAS